MRIGILTLPLHVNYGGILQAWALQTVLQRMGHEVEVVGIKPETTHAWYVMPFVWGLRIIRKLRDQYASSIFCEYWEKKENRKFKNISRFIKERINQRKLTSLEELISMNYDGIVVGSDQIWREDYIRYLWRCQFSENAFLFQFRNHALQKIAYAASFGIDEWTFDESTTINIKRALSEFNAISVRELSGIKLLKDKIGIISELVCDPTMLISAADYIKQFNIDGSEYDDIVSYILDSNSFSKSLINKIEEEVGEKITEINTIDNYGKLPSVEQWVKMISTARLVVTDSFHGCIFSLIFRRPLIFVRNPERGITRFDSIIETFGLYKNIIYNVSEFSAKNRYNLPEDIDSRIECIRQKSLSFLQNNLC